MIKVDRRTEKFGQVIAKIVKKVNRGDFPILAIAVVYESIRERFWIFFLLDEKRHHDNLNSLTFPRIDKMNDAYMGAIRRYLGTSVRCDTSYITDRNIFELQSRYSPTKRIAVYMKEYYPPSDIYRI